MSSLVGRINPRAGLRNVRIRHPPVEHRGVASRDVAKMLADAGGQRLGQSLEYVGRERGANALPGFNLWYPARCVRDGRASLFSGAIQGERPSEAGARNPVSVAPA